MAIITEAVRQESGSPGSPEAAVVRIDAYLADPFGASTKELGFVSGQTLKKYYLKDALASQEKSSLITEIRNRSGLSDWQAPVFDATSMVLVLSNSLSDHARDKKLLEDAQDNHRYWK